MEIPSQNSTVPREKLTMVSSNLEECLCSKLCNIIPGIWYGPLLEKVMPTLKTLGSLGSIVGEFNFFGKFPLVPTYNFTISAPLEKFLMNFLVF